MSEHRSVSEFRTAGIYRFHLDAPSGSAQLSLTATFSHGDAGAAEATARAYSSLSGQDKDGGEDSQIRVTTSSSADNLRVGRYATFHVKTFGQDFQQVDWLAMGRGLVLATGREDTAGGERNPLTFSLVVSREMSPAFTVVVMAYAADGKIIAGGELE